MGRSQTLRRAFELKFCGKKPMEDTQQEDSVKQCNTLEKMAWQQPKRKGCGI
jgi:hypothetical protein